MSGDLPGIDVSAVTTWLVDNIGAAPPLELSLIAAGGSNLTFRVTDADGRSWALRRPPATAVLATAHDVVREHRILRALSHHGDVPVPSAVAMCEDPAITGAPFTVMEFVDGMILRTEADGAALEPSAATAATESLVDVQVAMHTIDPDAIGLGERSRHRAGYLERQLSRWKRQVDDGCVRDLPLLDELHGRLVRTVPVETDRPTLVHGDYRFDNTVLGPDHRVRAVLDWELCTIGDATADFVWSLMYWADPGDPCPFLESSPTLAPAFCRRDQVAARYAERASRSLDALAWLVVFSYWKMACIVEGVHVRRLRGARAGSSGSLDVARIATRVDRLLEHARDVGEGIV